MLNNCTLFRNASASDYFGFKENTHPEKIVIIYCAINAPLIIMSIVGNALVIAAILGTPSLSSPSTTLLCNLAFNDFLIGLVVQPLFITKELTHDHSLWLIYEIQSYSLCGVSLWTMTAISADRFAALYFHMKYVTIVTTSRVSFALVAMWLIMFSTSSALFLWNRLIYFIVSSFFIILCLSTSSFCYIRIFQIVQRHQIQIHAQQQAVQNSTLLGMAKMDWQKEWNLATTLVFVNSSINPLLYCWRLRELRRAVVKTARKMLCKQTE
ncbi:melanocortin receptor 4-like [Oculina patagonica]